MVRGRGGVREERGGEGLLHWLLGGWTPLAPIYKYSKIVARDVSPYRVRSFSALK